MKNRLGGEGVLSAGDEADGDEGEPGLGVLPDAVATLDAPQRLHAGLG
ncbi:hypothetical protein [Methylobacterium sp. sgz302003]